MKKIKSILVFLFVSFMFTTYVQASNDIIYDNYSKDVMSCGSNLVTDIPVVLPKIISIIYTVLQIAVPVVLVVMGSLDLMKGITAQKEDEIKKGQQIFIKRLIYSGIIFFVFVIVKVVISFAADADGARIMSCAECFISNKCSSSGSGPTPSPGAVTPETMHGNSKPAVK